MIHLATDVLRNSVLISGLVIIMMMMIESVNIESHGRFLARLGRTKVGQVIFSAALGLIPGCIGGFASVSLYTHGMISFGALIAMMVVSSGDEAFMIMAMLPDKALWIFGLLFVTGIVSGLATDWIGTLAEKSGLKKKKQVSVDDAFALHVEDLETAAHTHGDELSHEDSLRNGADEEAKAGTTAVHKRRSLSRERCIIFIGVSLFIAALLTGVLDHEHAEASGSSTGDVSINFLSEGWMNILFAILSLSVLGVLAFCSDHFVKEHLWDHVIKRHLPGIFAWTFGILCIITFGLRYLDISSWISDNTALMILLAVAVGIIPESGPHMIFITLYAAGIVPFPVLLASSISQDGHSALPLLAENKTSFAKAKLINCAVALLCGFTAMIFV